MLAGGPGQRRCDGDVAVVVDLAGVVTMTFDDAELLDEIGGVHRVGLGGRKRAFSTRIAEGDGARRRRPRSSPSTNTPVVVPSEITMLPGSSSSVPTAPAAAERSAVPVKPSAALPETSAKPPSPPSRAAAGGMRPSKVGALVGPDDDAAAVAGVEGVGGDERVPASTEVVPARGSAPPPCQSPPMRMRAAAVRAAGVEGGAGELDGRAGDGDRAAARGGRGDEARRRCASRGRRWRRAGRRRGRVPPSPPPRTMAPERPPTLRASTTPERLTTWRAICRAVAALTSTRPPSAESRPLWRMSGLVVAVVVGGHGHLQEAVARDVERRPLAGAEADPAHARR